MSKEKSSIDWLIEKYTIVLGLGSKELMKEHIERARAMHEKEIINAHMNVSSYKDHRFNDDIAREFAEDYYKDKFA